MSNIITIGYSAEGTTDQRFLESIIKNTFEEVAFNCKGSIDVYSPLYINASKEQGFSHWVKSLSIKAYQNGLYVLCIHTDSDEPNDSTAFKNKINPALQTLINDGSEEICKNIVPIVPIQMSESWMLADKELLKVEINTNKSDRDLGIDKKPETISNPKQVIENALRIAQEGLPQRRRKLEIDEIYQPIGQKLEIKKLEQIPSYNKFKKAVEEAFRKLNYLK